MHIKTSYLDWLSPQFLLNAHPILRNCAFIIYKRNIYMDKISHILLYNLQYLISEWISNFFYYSLTVRKFLQAWKSRHISNSGMKFCPSLNQCPMTFVMLPLKVNPTFVCLTDKWCKFSSKVCLHETFSFASRLKMLSQTWKRKRKFI